MLRVYTLSLIRKRTSLTSTYFLLMRVGRVGRLILPTYAYSQHANYGLPESRGPAYHCFHGQDSLYLPILSSTKSCQLGEGGRPKDDLKAVSLVSRTLYEIAGEFLFHHVTIPLVLPPKSSTRGHILDYLPSAGRMRYVSSQY